ncbi:MAG: dockerin type I domain-containing protein, partial [Limnohabitans sp.]|nr:dockerin type I domain-containing protein [Limnohabitans sp.]
NAAANNLNRSIVRFWDFVRPLTYIFGDPSFVYGTEIDEWSLQYEFSVAYGEAMTQASPAGERFSAEEASALLAMPRPSHVEESSVVKAIERWNRTRDYWAMEWFNAVDVPAGFSTDFVERDRFVQYLEVAADKRDEYLDLGYNNPLEELASAYELLQGQVVTGQGACVSIGIELNQTLTLVRQAFEATLVLENAGASPIEAIDVDIVIEDLAGNDRTSRFAILGPAVTGMSDVNGNGQLAPAAEGSAKWTIVPGDSAAPEGPTYYSVRGQFRYASEGQVLVVPLFPVTITVYPNPSLSLQYFIETQVYSDDPFTPEIEPMIPFSLGLWAKNNGGGTAGDVRIESAQPEIVSNELGLLIDFQLIGAQVNENPISPSLLVEMGDILPNNVAVAQWLMTSTLQGEFVGYSATVSSTNGFNDPEFSVVDEAAVNAMTHVVRADEPLDDGRPDFLGNLTLDPKDLPDKVYLSSGVIEPVSAVTNASVSVVGNSATVTATPAPGWRYIRIEDPFGSARPIESVTRSDGKELQLGHNAWQTSYITRDTPTPEARRYVHIFDRGGDGVYLVDFAIDGEAPTVLSWQVLREHGSLGALGLEVPSVGAFSESRPGGIQSFVLSFSEPINPATFNAVSVAVTAYNASGVEVTVPVADRTAELRIGDQYASINFPTPLPNGLRYCIRLLGVTDVAGNLLDQGSGSIDIALVPGDVTGDLRVTVNDAGAIGSLLGQAVDPLDPYMVRADLNRDGTITMADASLVVAAIGTDLRFAINPCSDLGDENRRLDDGRSQELVRDQSGISHGAPLATRPTVSNTSSASRPQATGKTNGKTNGKTSAAVVVGRDDNTVSEAAVRFDVLALRADDSAFLEAIAQMYGLTLHTPAAEEARSDGWRIATLPAIAQREAAHRSLASLLLSEGLDVAAIAVLSDGTVAAVLPEVEVTVRAGIPDTWLDRVFAANCGGAQPVDRGGRIKRFDVRPRFGTEVTAFARALADRREFERVRCVTVTLSAADGAPDQPAGFDDSNEIFGSLSAELGSHSAPTALMETQP